MATYASIKYDMDLSSSATGTGGMTLLSTQTASSSATIDFTSGIDSTYDEYVFKYINMHPATDQSDFTFQTDTGTNTNYNQTITSTLFGAFNIESGDDDGLFYQAARDQAQGTAFQILNYNLGNGNDEHISGTLQLFSPSSTTFVKHFISRTMCYNYGNYADDGYAAGYVNTTTALTRVRFKMSSGNIDSGTIKMYGVS